MTGEFRDQAGHPSGGGPALAIPWIVGHAGSQKRCRCEGGVARGRSTVLARRLVLDTNVFVAAGFRRSSASAQLLELVRQGRVLLVWDEATRDETRRVLERIPRLSWEAVSNLFLPEGRHHGGTRPADFRKVADVADRKFAALSAAAAVPVVSADHDLLDHRGDESFVVWTPREALDRCAGAGA